MQICEEVEVQLQASLPSVPEEESGRFHAPSVLTPEKGPLVGYQSRSGLLSKGKFALEQAMETHRRSRRIAPFFLLISALNKVNVIPRFLYVR
jgi:hypothetical protein